MKKMQAKAAGAAARKGGMPVRSNIKSGDFWDDMRSMYSSVFNNVAGGGCSCASAGASPAGSTPAAGTTPASI